MYADTPARRLLMTSSCVSVCSVKGPVKDMSVSECENLCSVHGYLMAGLTGHAGAYNCYCGCNANLAAPVAPNASCAKPCAGANEPGGHCGGDGVMAAYTIQCNPKPPPSPICGGGTPLPDGPACSQQVSSSRTTVRFLLTLRILL